MARILVGRESNGGFVNVERTTSMFVSMFVARCAAIKILVFGLLVAMAASSAAACPSEIEAASTVEVVTLSDDGERLTTVWVTCVDGELFIRTSRKSAWGTEAEQEPQVQLIVGDSRLDFVAEFVSLDVDRASVTESFREKYGMSDVFATWIRGRDPRIMRLKVASKD